MLRIQSGFAYLTGPAPAAVAHSLRYARCSYWRAWGRDGGEGLSRVGPAPSHHVCQRDPLQHHAGQHQDVEAELQSVGDEQSDDHD